MNDVHKNIVTWQNKHITKLSVPLKDMDSKSIVPNPNIKTRHIVSRVKSDKRSEQNAIAITFDIVVNKNTAMQPSTDLSFS